MDQLIKEFGPGRTGVRVSPTGRVNEMYDSNPEELMKYLVMQLAKKHVAFIEIKEAAKVNPHELNPGEVPPLE